MPLKFFSEQFWTEMSQITSYVVTKRYDTLVVLLSITNVIVDRIVVILQLHPVYSFKSLQCWHSKRDSS